MKRTSLAIIASLSFFAPAYADIGGAKDIPLNLNTQQEFTEYYNLVVERSMANNPHYNTHDCFIGFCHDSLITGSRYNGFLVIHSFAYSNGTGYQQVCAGSITNRRCVRSDGLVNDEVSSGSNGWISTQILRQKY